MRHKGATLEDLRRLAMWLTMEEPQLRPVLDVAIDTVQRVSSSVFWVSAGAAPHATEAPFTVCRVAGDVLSGVIDLLYADADRRHVIDYETDAADITAVTAYERQLDQYRAVLSQLGIDADGSLISIRIGVEGPR
jgi:ATP-dependent exoDNAse (exonuclease V) beta subunit